MPGKSGKALLDLFRDNRPTLPALFATGYSDERLQADFHLDGCTRLLRKPYMAHELLWALHEVLQTESNGGSVADPGAD